MWNNTFCLRFTWLLFAENGSLWAQWHKYHHLKNRSLWEIGETSRDPWTWRMLLRLRPLAEKFLRSRVGNGKMTSFWHDIWTPLGSLIKLMGAQGPSITRIPLSAKVADACDEAGWLLSDPRSDSALSLHAHLTTISLPSLTHNEDSYCWMVNGVECRGFSSSQTWDVLRPRQDVQNVGHSSEQAANQTKVSLMGHNIFL